MIFVDTGAWFALAVQNDPDHEAAVVWLRQNRTPLLTTDYILAETATLLRMRDKTLRGHRLAVRIATTIRREESTILEKVTNDDLDNALRIFRTYRDHLFSFVDCTSFAVMERLNVDRAFAFDHHFDEYPGIVRLPHSV